MAWMLSPSQIDATQKDHNKVMATEQRLAGPKKEGLPYVCRFCSQPLDREFRAFCLLFPRGFVS